MKNILSIVLIATYLLTACSKDSMPVNLQDEARIYSLEILPSSIGAYKTAHVGKSVAYKIIDKRIVLENQEDFALFMWALESHDITSWLEKIPFQSYLTQFEKQDNTPHFNKDNAFLNGNSLAAALNLEGIIQIEPYIFKFDVQNEKIHVITSDQNHLMEALRFSPSTNEEIKSFSFQDDVWYLLENDLNPNQDALESINGQANGKKCSEQKASNKKLNAPQNSCTGTLYDWDEVTMFLRYNRFGIWEVCKATMYNNVMNVYGQSNEQLGDFQILSGEITYHFDERCGPAYNGSVPILPGISQIRGYILRSDKKPLAKNKSTVDLDISYTFLCSPTEPVHNININLSNF